jgi:hypothetical protein
MASLADLSPANRTRLEEVIAFLRLPRDKRDDSDLLESISLSKFDPEGNVVFERSPEEKKEIKDFRAAMDSLYTDNNDNNDVLDFLKSSIANLFYDSVLLKFERLEELRGLVKLGLPPHKNPENRILSFAGTHLQCDGEVVPRELCEFLWLLAESRDSDWEPVGSDTLTTTLGPYKGSITVWACTHKFEISFTK